MFADPREEHRSRRQRRRVESRRGSSWDVALYALSAGVALAVTLTAGAPLDRQWARVAAPAYTVAALVAAAQWRRRAFIRARALLAVALFAAVAAVPLLVHSAVRLDGGDRAHMKSDVLVVEQAASHLLHARDPYAVSFDEGPLASWPEVTRTHFPYLPATLAFGLPSAVAGPTPWTDPRLLYLTATLAIAVPAITLSRARSDGRLRVFQVLLVLMTGAPLVFTSGKELPVLALLLAALVALDRGHLLVVGILAGLAASAYQLAWVVLPFLVLARRPGTGEGAGRAAVAAAVVMLACIGPFLAWDAGALIDDVVWYPVAVGQPVAVVLPTPGGLLAAVVPGARWQLLAVLGVAIAVAAIVLVRKAPHPTASDVARGAGMLLLVAFLLAPRVRMAYFVFPLNLLLWARLLRPEPAPGAVAAGGPGRTVEPAVVHGRAASPPLAGDGGVQLVADLGSSNAMALDEQRPDRQDP